MTVFRYILHYYFIIYGNLVSSLPEDYTPQRTIVFWESLVFPYPPDLPEDVILQAYQLHRARESNIGKRRSGVQWPSNEATTKSILGELVLDDDGWVPYQIPEIEIQKLVGEDEILMKKRKKETGDTEKKESSEEKKISKVSAKATYGSSAFGGDARGNISAENYTSARVEISAQENVQTIQSKIKSSTMNEQTFKKKIRRNTNNVKNKKSEKITKGTEDIKSPTAGSTVQNRWIAMMKQNEENLMQFLLSSEFLYNVNLSAIITSAKEAFEKAMLKIHENVMAYFSNKDIKEESIVSEQRPPKDADLK